MKSIKSYLNQSCVIEHAIHRNEVGDMIYKDPITVPCRVSCKPRRVLTIDGTEISSVAVIHIGIPVGYDDRFTWIDAMNQEFSRTPVEIHNNINKDGSFAYAKVIL